MTTKKSRRQISKTLMILLRLPNTCFPSIQPLFFFPRASYARPNHFESRTWQVVAGIFPKRKRTNTTHPRALGLSLSCIAQKIKWGGKKGAYQSIGNFFQCNIYGTYKKFWLHYVRCRDSV